MASYVKSADVHIGLYVKSEKVGDAGAAVGGVEVDGEVETQQQGNAYGHVAVAAEVTIYLHGIAIDAQQVLDAGIQGGVVEDAVHEIERDIVADNGFLEQTDDNEIHSLGKHHAGETDNGNDTRVDDVSEYVARTDTWQLVHVADKQQAHV